jgi:5,10-methylenetetrahydromethanopterin reductase
VTRLGFAPAGSRDGRTVVALARAADELGVDEFWLSEDYLERGSVALAGAVAAATSAVTVGLGVINPWTRHVALTAMECGALDELSGGRLIVGLGASNRVWMQDRLGIPFEHPVAVLEEYAGALRTLLRGERLTDLVAGHPVDARLDFTPPRADVPIYFGVKGERALAAGARLADGLLLSLLSAPAYVAWVRERYGGAGLRAAAYVAFACDDDGAAARDRVRSRVARYLGVHGDAPITRVSGLAPDLAHRLRERFLAGREAGDLVDDAVLSTFAVAGTVDDCARGLRALADAGLDAVVVMDDGVADPHRVLRDAVRCATAAGLR